MGKCVLVVVFALCFASLLHGGLGRPPTVSGTKNGLENWGYVEVRPNAFMFWWLYRSPYKIEHASRPWPIILWLQGGPASGDGLMVITTDQGSSGVAYGNFLEVGPLDRALQPRNSTWLRKGDLLFVDNPVGTGFSYVKDNKLFVKTDEEAAADLTKLLMKLFNGNVNLQKSPLYIVAESYGGKYAVTLALSALKAIEAGKLKLKLQGIALGDSWISPEDYVAIWAPVLKDLSRIDYMDLRRSISMVQKIKYQIKNSQFVNATNSWSELQDLLTRGSNNVDFYNFMLDSGLDPVATTASALSPQNMNKRYSNYFNSLAYGSGGTFDLPGFMNQIVRKKLMIIPNSVMWGGQGGDVFDALSGDFMKPRINEVGELLAKGLNVTVYNGQVDLICATKGTEAWIRKLNWEGLIPFLEKRRTPLHCGDPKVTTGFTKSYKNLRFFWILNAGHFVPADQPCTGLNMVGTITDSPNGGF